MTAAAVAHRAGRRNDVKQASTAGAARGWLARALAWLIMVIVAVGATLGLASVAHADDDELDGVMSFYALASSTSSFLGNSLSPDNDDDRNAMWDRITKSPASGGSMLGYSDKNRNDGANWISSAWTAASHTMSYEAFNVKEQGGSEDALTSAASTDRLNGVIDYTHFGATLSGMGLDKTKIGLGLGFMNFIGGGIVLLLFIASYAIDWLFSAVISVLSTLNPFRLFFPAIQAINPEFAEGMVGGDTSDLPTGLAGLASFISQWYAALTNLSWTVMVPIFLGVLLVSLVMFKNLNKGSAVKKFVIRLAFIGLGLPLIGSMYTGALTAMQDATSGNNDGSTRVVVSTFVDFESWVLTRNLGFPDEAVIEWDTSRSRPSDNALMNVRSTTLAINKAANWRFATVGSAFDESGSWSEQARGDGAATANSFSATTDLLGRYMSGNMITASDYETQVKGVLGNRLSNDGTEDARKRVTAWFKGFKDGKKLNDPGHKTEDIKLEENIPGNGMLVVNDGAGLMADPSGATYQVKKFTSTNAYCSPSVTAPTNCNLAPLAMYNYLNTTFGSESYTVYSAANSTSGATREVHNSVNLVGTGLMSMVYWINAVVLLGAFVTIGLGYALGMAVSNIRRSLQIITAIPFATLGALAGIAKVVVYSFALIIELMITIFLYMMVQEFLISLPQIIEMPFSTVLNTGDAAAIMAGSSMAMIIGLITVVVTIMFTIMALRLRKTLVKAVEEAVTKLVNKFMDTSAGAPGGAGGKMMPALAGGMAAGAGAAAMNKAMGGGPKGPKSNAGGLNGSGPAPTAVGTGGGDGQAGPDGGGTFEVDGEAGEAGSSGGDGTAPDAQGGGASQGNPGTSVTAGGGDSVTADSATTEKGKDVAANGLSDPTAAAPKGDPTAQAGANQDDAMSTASASAEQSAEKYKEADTAGLKAAKSGAEAVGHGAVAAGAAYAGDAKTATEHGAKAVQSGAEANAQVQEGKQASKDAGRSSLDKPDNSHAKKAEQSRQVGQAAGAVGSAAGAANGGKGSTGKAPSTGGTPKAAAPKGGSGQPKASGQRPQQPKGQAPAPAPQRQGGGNGGGQQRQQAPKGSSPAPRPAPAPKQQAPAPRPAPQPKQQAPASRPAPVQRSQPQQRQAAPPRQQGQPAPSQPRRRDLRQPKGGNGKGGKDS